MSRLPLIGITACSKQIGLYAFHVTGDKYIRAKALGAEGISLVLPSLDPPSAATVKILHNLEGLMFTGVPLSITPSMTTAQPSRAACKSTPSGKLQQTLTIFYLQGFGDVCRKPALQRDAAASNNA